MTTPPQHRSSARTWLAMVPMLLGVLIGALAISATTTALPAMRSDMHMTDAAAIWIVDIYPLALAVTLVIAARAGDQFGRRTVMMLGLVGFAAFNLIGGMTDSVLVLIIMRALLGASEAMVIASVVSTIGAVFQPGERVLAYGLWTATFGAGSAFGPVAGGILAEGPGWRWTLYGGIPLAIIALLLALFLVPNTRTARAPHWDALSIVTSIIALGGLVYALQHVALEPVVAIVVGVIGAAAGVTFVRRQRQLSDPFIDVGLFRIRDFSIAYVRIIAGTGASAATVYLVSLHLQDARGETALTAGFALLPQAIMIAIGGVLAPTLLRWLSSNALTVAALAMQAIGLVWLATDPASLVGALLFAGFGFGLIGTLTAAALFDATHPEQAGQVGAIQEVGFALGSGLGVAVLGTIALVAGTNGYAVALVTGAALVIAAALLNPRLTRA
ncbi:MFS transporter [Microbacterium mitrae]|uniref:MFS transporter n=1 Tax=Microbacterium mitrae TaxID=664640 RepID=A0A5C8HP64_9MICO|nr:MFS transporter [Microbacterium mitrae]TXK04601.1 MFS transporter [Microbacterium mitrae]